MTLHAPLIIDIAGTTLTEVDRRRSAHPLVGGMILFGRNWQSRAQLTELCAEIKNIRADLLIAVDHEGGRVQRLREGFTTDNGNLIIDVHGLSILDPVEMEAAINNIPGVVTVGLFARRGADVLLLGTADGVRTLQKK